MKWINKDSLINIFQIVTISVILSLILYRYRIHLPHNIFEQISFYKGITYFILCIINLVIIIYMCFSYYNQNANSSSIMIYLNKWINKSYDKIMDIIAELPNPISGFIAKISNYYIKIPIVIIQIIDIIPRILLMIVMFIDVFYFKRFEYTYYFLYLLLIPLISRGLLYIFMETNSRILLEISNSMVIKNSIKVLNNQPLTPIDYELTPFNTQLKSIEEGLSIKYFTLNEQLQLTKLYNAIQWSFFMKIIIRIFYMFIWGYIFYFYPIPVIIILTTLVYNIFAVYIGFNILKLFIIPIFLYILKKLK